MNMSDVLSHDMAVRFNSSKLIQLKQNKITTVLKAESTVSWGNKSCLPLPQNISDSQ